MKKPRTPLGKFLGLSLFFFFLLAPRTFSNQDYKFIDGSGNEIIFPKEIPVFSQSNPGPWKKFAEWHHPEIKSRTRKDGLETIRILSFKISHPMNEDEKNPEGRIEAIYLLDKDNLLAGHYAFSPTEKEAKADIWINGVINFVQVYIRCTKHQMWRTEYQIK